MKFFAAVAATLATTAFGQWCNQPAEGCLTQAQVDYLISQEILYLQHPNITQAREVAYEIFTPDVMEYGDSINSLRNETVSSLIA